MSSKVVNNPQQLPPLTKRQKEVLDIITDQYRKTRTAPTIRELAELLGLSSSASVHRHLITLEKKGYINLRGRSQRVSRTKDKTVQDAQLQSFEKQVLDFITLQVSQNGVSPTIRQIVEGLEDTSSIGKVQRTLQSLKEKNYIVLRDNKQYISLVSPSRDTYYPILEYKLPMDYKMFHSQDNPALIHLPLALLVDSFQKSDAGNIFVVRLLDDSLASAGIFKNDYVLVKKQDKANTGDIVVVKYQERVILRLYRENKSVDTQSVWLRTANKDFESINARADEISILGIGVGLMRRSFLAATAFNKASDLETGLIL